MSRRLRFVAHAFGAVAAGLTAGFAITTHNQAVAIIAVVLALGLIVSVVLGMTRSPEAAA